MEKIYAKNKNAYNKKSGDYDNTTDGKFTKKFKDMLVEIVQVKNGDNILDVACGNGTLLSRLAEGKDTYCSGTDISIGMIESARTRFPQFNFAEANCEQLPFDDDSMNLVTVCAAYHHFPDVNAFAREAARVTKKDGNIYVAEIFLPPILRHIANIFVPLSKDGDVKFYSRNEIVNTFTNAGFHFYGYTRKKHIQIITLQK
jgi:ubiquinone/menaquinone biosynthesis C-methylase UbiE